MDGCMPSPMMSQLINTEGAELKPHLKRTAVIRKSVGQMTFCLQMAKALLDVIILDLFILTSSSVSLSSTLISPGEGGRERERERESFHTQRYSSKERLQ